MLCASQSFHTLRFLWNTLSPPPSGVSPPCPTPLVGRRHEELVQGEEQGEFEARDQPPLPHTLLKEGVLEGVGDLGGRGAELQGPLSPKPHTREGPRVCVYKDCIAGCPWVSNAVADLELPRGLTLLRPANHQPLVPCWHMAHHLPHQESHPRGSALHQGEQGWGGEGVEVVQSGKRS
jgi:hypothetical protein